MAGGFKMMTDIRKISFAGILLLCFLSSKGQETPRRGYVGIAGGPALPIGNFGNTDIVNSNSGYALPGGCFEFNFAYLLVEKLGIALSLRQETNDIDGADFANDILSSVSTSSIEIGRWQTNCLLAGVYYSVPLGNGSKFFLDNRFMVGFVTAMSPAFVVTDDDSLKTVLINNEPKTTIGFGTMIATGVRFNVSRRICLLANTDLFFVTASFKESNLVEATLKTAKPENDYEYNQPMTTLNFSIGIALRLK